MASLKFSQHLQQKQTMSMKQLLSPQMIQLLKTFQLSYNDLYQEAETLAQDNPLVDLRPDRLMSTGSTGQPRSSAAEDISSFEDSIKDPHTQNLTDTLMTQMELQYLEPTLEKIVITLIENLDNKGYLTDYTEVRDTLVKTLDIAPRKVSDGLKILQSFDPEGVGARSLKECLQLQLSQAELESQELTGLIKVVIQNHLEDLAEQRYDVIANKLDISSDAARLIHEYIRDNLQPNPAHEFSTNTARQLVTPSYEVSLDTHSEPSKLILNNLEERDGFQISLSSQYEKMLNDPALDAESKQFLTQKAADAKAFIDRVNKRHDNLNRLAEFVLYKQENYVRYGPHYLEPLSQKEVADYLAISSSTVSRILSSKHIRTPHGVVLFKTLCPRNHFGKTAERLKFLIQDLVDRHPTASDERLKEKLHNIGIPMARRTIAKYRAEIGLGSSYSR